MKLIVDALVFILAAITARDKTTIFNVMGWTLVGFMLAGSEGVPIITIVGAVFVVLLLTVMANIMADMAYRGFREIQASMEKNDENSQPGG